MWHEFCHPIVMFVCKNGTNCFLNTLKLEFSCYLSTNSKEVYLCILLVYPRKWYAMFVHENYTFVFRSSITMILRPDFTVIHTSLECTWYLYIIVFYALIICLPYHCSIRFLFSFRAGGLRAGGFFVPDGTVGCHYDDLWCCWWRRGCGLDDHLFSVLD